MSTHLDTKDINYAGKLPDIFRLGKKMLIKAERLNEFVRIEARARSFLDVNSYDFPVADAHFVPKKKVAMVLETLDGYKKKYLALRDSFVLNYPTYKKEILDAYPELSAALEPAYPPADKIGAKFDFSVSLYELQMPNELGKVDIQSLITRDKAEAEVKKEFEERLAGHYKTSLTKIDTFTQEAAALLRAQMVSACHTLVEKIKNKEVISKRNLERIREDIADFKALNFFDDKQVEAELDKLNAAVSGNVNYKNDEVALEELSSILSGVLKKATNTSDLATISEGYFRAIKL
jgi:hypothetical protein